MDLSPDWVVGFVDGEGCFYVGINPQPQMSLGYQVLPEFRVVQHKRDAQALHALKRFFRAGVVRTNHGDRYELRIRRLKDLNEVVSFFRKHPLKTRKQVDFTKFARIVEWIGEGKHLTLEGLMKIIRLSMTMNREDKARAKIILAELEEKQAG
jgi:LAGLIDADG endonuclease